MTPNRTAWLFVAPALLAIGVFFLLPAAASFFLSLTDFDLYALADLATTYASSRLDNYIDLLQRPLFWQALGNTLYFVDGRRAALDCCFTDRRDAAELGRGTCFTCVLPHRAVCAGGDDDSSRSR
jgi:hypothetical protein